MPAKKTPTKNNRNTNSKNKNQKGPATPKRSKVYFGAALVVALSAVVGILALLPDSSPVSLTSLTGRNSDRTAPKLDMLSGNYSVAGEAASTSLLVKFKASVPESARAKVNQELSAKTKRNIAPLGVEVVQVSSNESLGEIIRKYKSRAEVDYAEPNYLAKRFLTPDDTLFTKQWHLHKIEAPTAWDTSQGGYGPVAVIDTGILSSQTDLNGSVLTGFNFVNDTTDTNDDNGHGTHVAGIISATTNNATGVSSIGFKGSLLPVKVLDNTGAGTYGDVASGIVFATDKGAKILNLSLGGSSASRTLEDAVKYAQSQGVVVIAAAGNNGNSTAVYPAAYPGVVAVSASDQNDNLASFSSYGSHIYVSAPGTGVISTYNSGGYATMSGTSMSTPLVSGLIGLALSKGTTTASGILTDLKSTSDKVGPYAYDQNGWNQYFGYGRINAAKLLGTAAINEPADTEDPVEESSPSSPSRPSQSPDRAVNPQFDTVVEGTIDSIDLAQSRLIIKVASSSENLLLQPDNLIDLYVSASTTFTSGGSQIAMHDLKVGYKLHIKAQWKDNRLDAKDVTVLGKPATQQEPGSRRPR